MENENLDNIEPLEQVKEVSATQDVVEETVAEEVADIIEVEPNSEEAPFVETMPELEIPLEAVTYRAYAKINLSLEVLGKRPDGFHNLSTVMQTVSLCDLLHFIPSPDLEFDCNIPELVDENNLVWRAALRLLEKLPEDQQKGAKIILEKNVPVAGGLGGGSSDAATTLIALNDIWELNLSREELLEEAAQLGSDVPFFIHSGTVLAEGRGEKLTPLHPMQPSWIVLLNPGLQMPANKTAQLYRSLYRNDFSDGSLTRQLVNYLQAGQRPPQSLLFNTFERVAYERFPELEHFRRVMVEAGADYVRLSGSGPTLFTLLSRQDEATQIAQDLQEAGFQAFLATTVG